MFSKICLLVLTFAALPSWALNLTAIYTSACKRELGTIIYIDGNTIKYLNLDGKIIHLRPHEIIFLAYYPIDQLPISNEIDFSKVQALKIRTQEGTEIKNLVSGWPIGFTKDKISFLTPEGRETMINRQNIFSLDYYKIHKTRFTSARSSSQFTFVHPHVFRECPIESKSSNKTIYVYPQQVLSDPIMIKREIDHLKEGYIQVERYYREQNYYPIAEIYPNTTSLGIWQSFGSRYGSATHRNNNLAPVLTDSYSSDIFDYQHIFITGSAPLMFSLHEEPQTQIYYAFKSSYFHFSSMIDPSLMLVGRNYEWQNEDFDKSDDKLVSSLMLEMGFDFGKYTLDLYMGNSFHVGISTQNSLMVENVGLPMFGMSYRSHNYKFQFLAGSGEYKAENPTHVAPEQIQLSGARANLSLYYWEFLDLTYSFIFRDLKAEHPSFRYESHATTHAGYASYKLYDRYHVGGYLALESHSRSFGPISTNSEESSNYIKAGGFVSLSF